MGGGRTPFASPVFTLQNCKIKSGEVPYSQFICFRGPFEAPVQAGTGRADDGREASLFQGLQGPQCCGSLWLSTSWTRKCGKKSHFFNIFLLLLPDAQCHFQLRASVSVVTCPGATCCDPVGQTQHAEDAKIKCTVFGKHVGPRLVRGSWAMRLQ